MSMHQLWMAYLAIAEQIYQAIAALDPRLDPLALVIGAAWLPLGLLVVISLGLWLDDRRNLKRITKQTRARMAALRGEDPRN